MKTQILIALILFGLLAGSAAGTATISFDRSIQVEARTFTWENTTFTVTNVGNYKLNDQINIQISSGVEGMRVILYDADKLSEWNNPDFITGGEVPLTIPPNTVNSSGTYGIVISSEGYIIGANPVIISEYNLIVTPDKTQATAGSTIKVTVQVSKNGVPVNVSPNTIKVEFVLGSTSTYFGGNAVATATEGTYVASVQIPTSGDYRSYAAIATNKKIYGYPELIGAGDGGAIKITASSSPPSSSGGGGGDGLSGEEFKNIEATERYEKYISKDVPASYNFRTPGNPINEIVITSNINAGDITVKTELLRGTSSLINSPAPGLVYKNINIIVGTPSFAVPKNIKEAVVKFKVENSWLNDNRAASSDVRMVRWDGSKWNELETSEKTKDNTYTYYEAKTTYFSPFAITLLQKAVVPEQTSAEPAVTSTVGTTVSETTSATGSAKKIAGFEGVIALIAVLAVCLLKLKKR